VVFFHLYTPLPIKRSSRYGNNYWEAFSVKINRDVRFFSDLEYDNWILVESDPSIVQFCEQPKKIQIIWQEQLVESIFDMWTQDKDGVEQFIEVKYSHELNPEDKNFSSRSFKQTQAQAKWCRDNAIAYSIRTDRDIRGNSVYLNNLKNILPYVQQQPNIAETIQHQIMKLLNSAPKVSIERIEQHLPGIPRHRIREAVYLMIFRGMIGSTIDQRTLDSRTEVWNYA
jgi:hypothetical protein